MRVMFIFMMAIGGERQNPIYMMARAGEKPPLIYMMVQTGGNAKDKEIKGEKNE